MIVTTTETIPNKEITEILGVARGSTVRARNFGYDFFASLKTIIGGEISEYTKLQADSREQAMQRMVADAKRLGADAIVGFRLTSATIMQGASEILAYGTAVRLQRQPQVKKEVEKPVYEKKELPKDGSFFGE